MIRYLLLIVLCCLSFASHAGEHSLPLKDGAYIRNPEWCEKYFRNDLDFIDFEVEQNGRSFDFINVRCIVYSVKQIRKSRYSVEADCTEVGEHHQKSMILDLNPDQSIRIDGGELHHFCKRQEKSKKPDTFTANADDKPLGTDQIRHIGKSVPTLIAEWEKAYEGCRGGAGDDPKTDEACNEYGELEVLLNQSGQCYEDSGWKPCEGEAPSATPVPTKSPELPKSIVEKSKSSNLIALGGLNMMMGLDQQKSTLGSQGYKCETEKYPWGGELTVCKNVKMTVIPSKNNVRFNCHVFNVCKWTLKELAQSLTNKGFVKQMEYKPEFVTNLEGNKVFIEKFSGRGDEGEVLCVEADKNIFGRTLRTVILERGRLGQGSVSFD